MDLNVVRGDAVLLAGGAGALLSLVFSYFPGLSTWYAGQAAAVKRIVMALALLVVSAALLVLSCSGLESPLTVACSKAGLAQLALTFAFAAYANQSTYPLTKRGKPAV